VKGRDALCDFIFDVRSTKVWITQRVCINLTHKFVYQMVPLALMGVFSLYLNQNQYQFS